LTSLLSDFKEGSYIEDDSIITYIFVKSDVEFQRCLTVKYDETHFLWSKYGTPTVGGENVREIPIDEYMEVRRSARLSKKK
jgi:hypothetical protein